jgi:lysophospholipase L1-like esterase
VRPSGAIHYVAIGASDTVGVGSLDPVNGSWPSRVAALMPAERTYRNLGVSGSLAAQAQRDQLPVAIREQPTVVTVWLAVNDLNAQVPAPTYGASLGAIVDGLVQGTAARIFVGNVPDLRAVPVYAALDPAALVALVQSYNAQIAAVAAKHTGRVTVVDLFTGSAELASSITVAADGFHPSDSGYALIARRFADAMRRGGIPLKAAT